MRYLLLLLLLLSACYQCKVENAVRQSGTPALHTDLAFIVMQEKVPCDLKVSGQVFWFDSPLGAIEAPTACWRPAMGCVEPWDCEFYAWISNRHPPSGPDILPVWRTALVNEVGYWVWIQCYGFLPEEYVNGVEILDPGFAAWMNEVNAETQRRAGAN